MQFLNNIFNKKEISIIHEFHKPPYGGGNQFLLALKKEFENRKFNVVTNSASNRTICCLFNSFNFEFDNLREIKKKYPKVRMIHRVDGPIGTYRGEGEDIDKKIYEINHEIADATIFQSDYSSNKHIELGLNFKNPTIIHNAVDSKIFNTLGKIGLPANRKVKLVASSWSDNPKKGGPVYKWIEEHLDFDKYEFTFIGRTQQKFEKVNFIEAVGSEELASILKQHDIYITASQNDPCSNALIEALSCGLPAVYLNSGGHPELVGQGGVGFNTNEEALTAIDKVTADLEHYQKLIKVESMNVVAEKYLNIMLNNSQ